MPRFDTPSRISARSSAGHSRQVTVGSPTLSPDASTVAYVVTRVDLEGNAYRSAIWLAASDGSVPPRQLSSGEHGDGQPAWSPDGTRLAFTRHTSSDAGKRPRHTLHVLHVDGIARCSPSPSATRRSRLRSSPPTVRRSRSRPACVHRGTSPRASAPRSPAASTGCSRASTGRAGTIDRPSQVFVVPADGGSAPRQLTDGAEAFGPVAWAPDGRRLVFESARHPHADLDRKDDLWSIELDPAAEDRPEPVRLTRTEGAHAAPSFHADGRRLAFYVKPVDVGYHNGRLSVLDLEQGTDSRVAAGLDRNLSPADGSGPAWDGDDLLTAVEDRGTVQLLRISPDGSVRDPCRGHGRSPPGPSRWVCSCSPPPTAVTRPSCSACAREPSSS